MGLNVQKDEADRGKCGLFTPQILAVAASDCDSLFVQQYVSADPRQS